MCGLEGWSGSLPRTPFSHGVTPIEEYAEILPEVGLCSYANFKGQLIHAVFICSGPSFVNGNYILKIKAILTLTDVQTDLTILFSMLHTIFDLITMHTPICAQSSNSIVFRLQSVNAIQTICFYIENQKKIA